MSAATPTRIRKPLTAEQTTARNTRRRERTAKKRAAAGKPAYLKPAAKKAVPFRSGHTRKKTKPEGRKTRIDWNSIIYKLQHGPKNATVRRKCSTPGVAQVTRVRLLNSYEGIEAETKGVTLILSCA